MSIPVVNHKKLQAFLHQAYKTLQAAFVWGTFGIGKTAAILAFARQWAEENGLVFSSDPNDINDEKKFVVAVIPLHQFDAAEFKGLPTINREKRITEYFNSGFLPNKGQGLLFFDELNLAPPLVQANAYQLILDRRLGAYELPKGFLAMAAGNMIEDRAHVQEMAYPLKNRFVHVQLVPATGREWVDDYAIPKGLNHYIINFILGREDALHAFNPDSNEDMIAIPTHRTWEKASVSIEGLSMDDTDLVETMIGSAVGSAMAQQFMAWTKLSRKVDIEKIFKAGKMEVPEEVSEKYALISAIISYYSKKPTPENAEKVLDLSGKFDAEHTVLLLHLAKNTDKDKEKDKQFFAMLRKQCPAKLKGIAEDFVKFLI